MMKSSNRPLLLVMILTLTIFGGALIYFTMEYLSPVTRPDSPPTEAMSHQIGMLLLVVTMLAGMPAVGFGAYVMYLGSRIRVTRQWPPAGMGFRAEAPVMLGDRGTFLGAVVMGLGFVLAVCGLALPVVGWQLGNVFLE
jgi:hypothetical protein